MLQTSRASCSNRTLASPTGGIPIGEKAVLTGQSRSIQIARLMIRRHGLQASAVAGERATVAQLEPDAEGVALWHSVQLAISELRPHRRMENLRSVRSVP
jgi:hypothetical protein